MHESLEHAALTLLFRKHPELAVMFAAELGVPTPSEWTAEAVDPVVQVGSLVSDVVVVLRDGRGVVRRALIVELQRDVRRTKKRVWGACLWAEQLRRGCDVEVIVVTGSRKVAAWAAVPFQCGINELRVRVLGPDQLPRVTEPAEAAAHPELALMSLVTGGAGDAQLAAARAAIRGFQGLSLDEERLYTELVQQVFGKDRLRPREDTTMHHEGYTGDPMELLYGFEQTVPHYNERAYTVGPNGRVVDFDKLMSIEVEWRHRAFAAAEMLRQTLIRLLELRGFTVPHELRERVRLCRYKPMLDVWIERTLTATALTDIFKDGIEEYEEEE